MYKTVASLFIFSVIESSQPGKPKSVRSSDVDIRQGGAGTAQGRLLGVSESRLRIGIVTI